ncbi:HAD family hydrolase [Aestuariibacter salexigens]|uniref:HAD family hydrolase n=1 Tax=Aestuariibacter salexigens TaxID=226010 RepID=UPI0003FF7F81|nr:HAD-IIB family hydrolase [Aestuariibacter salexigens]
MDLIFFDLDGTLLNKQSSLSTYTRDTLNLLTEKRIAHTIATGRTMQSAQRVIGSQLFNLPHIYSNGVAVWDPKDNGLTLSNLLDNEEIDIIVDSATSLGLAPFINTVATSNASHSHVVFYGPTHHKIEEDLIANYFVRQKISLKPYKSLPANHQVTNISMIGARETIQKVNDHIAQFDNLVAYSGQALEGEQFSWIDIHHKLANKGSAVEELKSMLGATNVICFGDSYNDLSMFELADEAYAPSNAKDEIKRAATDIIGHHDDDGVAQFLRDRFSL